MAKSAKSAKGGGVGGGSPVLGSARMDVGGVPSREGGVSRFW